MGGGDDIPAPFETEILWSFEFILNGCVDPAVAL